MDINKQIEYAKMRILRNELMNYRYYEMLEDAYEKQLDKLEDAKDEIGEVQAVKYDTIRSQNPTDTGTKMNVILSEISEKKSDINNMKSKMNKIEAIRNRVDDAEARDIITKKYILNRSWRDLSEEFIYSNHALRNKVDKALMKIVGGR